MKMWMMAAIVAAVAGPTVMQAQMAGGPPPSPAVGTVEKPGAAIDGLLGELESEVIGAAKVMPADKYSFAPAATNFASGSPAKFEGVRTFAGELSHIAQANYFFFAGWCGKPDVDMRKVGELKTKDELIPAVEASFAYAHKCVATITPENAFVAVKPVDGFSTRVAITAFAAAHGNDHYGQMVEYLRMNGLLPPGSK